MKKQTTEEAADHYVFITNGHKFSNNDNTAGDNYKSFIDGANWYKENNYIYTEDFIQWLDRSDYSFCKKIIGLIHLIYQMKKNIVYQIYTKFI